MLAWFFLGVCLLVAGLVGAHWFIAADPRKLVRTIKIAGMVALALLVVALLLTRQIGLLAPLAVIAMGMLGRRLRFSFPGAGTGAGGGRPRPGQASEVETDWLSMSLDHDSGEIGGRVRKGPFAGRQLASLGFAELLSLLADCQREDEDGAALLISYLDRTQGEDWRQRAAAAGGGSAGGAPADGDMSEAEALEILGLRSGAGADEIRAAHHRLMKHAHPDHGGSDYLARKINQAKDLLLKGQGGR